MGRPRRVVGAPPVGPRAGPGVVPTRDATGSLAPGPHHPRGDKLTGVLPLVVYKPRFRPVNCDIAGLGVLNAAEPVCVPGHETEVAVALGRALGKVEPVPDVLRLGYMGQDSPWTPALQAAWPWRTTTKHVVDSCPRFGAHLDGGYEPWLARRSAHFRQHLHA